MGFKGQSGLSLGAVLTMNKVSSTANATVDFASLGLPAATISTGNGVLVSADDAAQISATTTLVSDVVTNSVTNQQQVKSTSVAGAISLNDVNGGAHALLQHATVALTGGDVQITGKEASILTAILNVKADTSGVQFGGNNSSLATGALISTNVVRMPPPQLSPAAASRPARVASR